MATAPCCTRFGEFPVVYGFRGFGLGDWASDAYLGTSVGQSALAAAKAAAALLPPGFTMGDPTSVLWGASYYNGHKVVQVGASGPNGQLYYGLDDGSLGPVVSDATNQAIQNAANAAYGVYSYINGLRTSTNPDMVAVLSDPEWITAVQPVIWSHLSAGLQAKIKKVPNLYNQLIAGDPNANATPVAPSPPPPPPASVGPARYLISGITFGDDGTVFDINGQGNPQGLSLSAAEVQSLKTTGALPSGDTFGKPIVPSMAPPTTNPTSQPTGPTNTAPQSPPTPIAPSGPSDTSPQSPTIPVTLQAPTPTPVVADTTAAPSIFSSIPWYMWAGGAAVLLLSRKKS